MFASAFLAATVLPLSSEVVLGFLLTGGADPPAVLTVATLGNVLGSLANYFIGLAGTSLVLEKFVSPLEIEAARKRFKAYGSACLIFAWVPVIGDPLTIAAGMLKIHLGLFLVLVTLGKLGRYIALFWALGLL